MCPTRTLPVADRSPLTQEPRSHMARTWLQTDRLRPDALTRFPRMQAGRAKHRVAHHGDSGYYPEVFTPRRRLGGEAAPVRSWRHEARLVAAGAVEEIIEQADYLYGSGETKKLYQLLTQHKNSEDAEILWRLARASRDLAQLTSTSAEEKKQLVYEALEYAKKALEKNESSFAVHKWYAICISDVGDYEGIKTKIANAYVIKEHFQKAIELNPKDATSIHLMGIWCYSFAEMPWYQSKIAAMLFAAPPSSTYEEALSYFHKAEEVDPNFYSKNLLLLGKTYLKLNNRKMALLWLTKTRDYPAHTEEDKQVQKEAAELLNSI
ncbi:regulator of microtubule dynamics protein 1 isoform X1 [Chelonoidis abingdonii]|uniref:regulator of microtubule dynamics protein 1 isoform X1 n=1 Tax=Chelonoidis abingdonii TaxID=106734 RepID=UPI0013F1AEED|nr:regulator of microtubule dynamics protein 1 isoform X1 [Chelonoidis abingdonii]